MWHLTLLACGGCNIPTGFLHIWLAPHATVCSRAWVAQKMQSTLNHIWALRKEQNPRNLDLSKEEWSITNQGNMFLSHTKEQVMLMTSPDLLPENTVTTNDNCMAKGYIHIKDTYTLVSLKHFMSINPYFIHVIYNFTSSVKHWRHLQSQQQNSDWKCHSGSTRCVTEDHINKSIFHLAKSKFTIYSQCYENDFASLADCLEDFFFFKISFLYSKFPEHLCLVSQIIFPPTSL